MMKNVLSKNILTSLILQFVTIVSGFITPKIILSYFGSETNGLISSINQLLNYIQLIEGGLGSVIIAALYKPLNEKNEEKINGVLNSADSFFKKIALIYIIYTLVIGIIYPRFIHTSFTNIYVFLLVLVLAMNLFVQYFFSITFKLLLTADRKVYVVYLTQIFLLILNICNVVLCAKFFADILIIKTVAVLIFLVAPIIYSIYVKKHYKLDKKIPKDNNALKSRWNGFGINLAYFIHCNTDIVILTIFTSLSDVSIYSVYAMIVLAIKGIVMSVSNAIVPSFGNILSKENQKKSNEFFDLYEFAICFVSVIIFSCSIILITPFVTVYTQNIKDADYYRPLFGVLLVISEMIYCLRDPYVSASYSAGHFKQVSKYAYGEAIINIIVSFLLVKKLGLVGVALGTIAGMFFRYITQAFYLKNNILNRSFRKSIKAFSFVSIILVLVILFGRNYISMRIDSYFEWFFMGIIVFSIVTIVTFVFSYLFYKKEFLYIFFTKIKEMKRR